jgi:CelD/BcsL family acetyltransferase involved in cellulose biosynthesis
MPDTPLPIELAIDDPRWRAFIDAHPEASIFHHPAWIGVLAECYGFRPALLALAGGDRIVAGVPVMEVRGMLRGRRIVSLPFSDHCAPLLADDALLPSLADAMNDFRRRRRCDRFELHWELPPMPCVHAGPAMLLHVTDLPNDPGALFDRFHRTRVQQPIRSAGSRGLVTRIGNSFEEMERFYELHLATRRRLGVPVQPLRFFHLLWERIIARDLGFTMLVVRGEMPIAGAIFLRMKETLTYKFSASLEEYWPENPNHLLLWDAMRHGIELGMRRFDWGKSDPEHAGLRDFKRGWGSSERAMTTAIIADAPPMGPGGMLARYAAPLIRHSPRWVCRMIGELLYREFA